jgi:hypothetical protein
MAMTAMSAKMMMTQISRLMVKATPRLPSPYRRLLPPVDELDQAEDEEDTERAEERREEDEPWLPVAEEDRDGCATDEELTLGRDDDTNSEEEEEEDNDEDDVDEDEGDEDVNEDDKDDDDVGEEEDEDEDDELVELTGCASAAEPE